MVVHIILQSKTKIDLYIYMLRVQLILVKFYVGILFQVQDLEKKNIVKFYVGSLFQVHG